MTRLIEPLKINEGVPSGEAVMWYNDANGKRQILPIRYTDPVEALREAPDHLLASGASEVIVNYKAPDESYMDVYVLKHIRYPRREPSKLWAAIKNIFNA